MQTKVPLEDLVKGRVYAIRTRNLAIGVYTGNGDENMQWFKGIRTKFDYKYATEEQGVAFDAGETWGDGKGGVTFGGYDPDDIVLLGEMLELGEFTGGS